jgi:hypothetical protein
MMLFLLLLVSASQAHAQTPAHCRQECALAEGSKCSRLGRAFSASTYPLLALWRSADSGVAEGDPANGRVVSIEGDKIKNEGLNSTTYSTVNLGYGVMLQVTFAEAVAGTFGKPEGVTEIRFSKYFAPHWKASGKQIETIDADLPFVTGGKAAGEIVFRAGDNCFSAAPIRLSH